MQQNTVREKRTKNHNDHSGAGFANNSNLTTTQNAGRPQGAMQGGEMRYLMRVQLHLSVASCWWW